MMADATRTAITRSAARVLTAISDGGLLVTIHAVTSVATAERAITYGNRCASAES